MKPSAISYNLAVIGAAMCFVAASHTPLYAQAAHPSTTMTEEQQQLELHLVKGTVKFGEKNYQAALEEFQAAREAVPSDFSASLLLGVTYLRLKQYDKAVQALRGAHDQKPEAHEAYLPLGEAYYFQMDYPAAVPFLEQAQAAEPDNPLAHYLLGAALFRMGEYKKAQGPLQTAGELDPSLKQSSEFMRGASAFKLGRLDEAKELFSEAQRIDPTSDVAGFSEQFSRGIAVQEQVRKPITFHLASSFGFDTNVQQIFSDAITNNNSTVTTYEAGIQIKPIQRPDLTVGGGYTFLGHVPHEFNELDIQGHVAYLYASKKFGPIWLAPQYVYTFYELNTRSFLQINSVKPTISIPWRNTLTQAFYEFQDREFFTIRLRKGSVHAVGAKEFVSLFNNKVRLEVGYRAEEEAATGDDFDRALHTISGQLTIPTPLSTQLHIRGYWRFKDYFNTHSLFGVERDEEEQTVGGYVSRKFGKYVTVTGGYQYLNNDANVSAFDMNKNYYTAEVAIDF